MPVYQRETFVRAPFETVWDFHSHVSGLTALTPDWMNLRIEKVVGPDGEEEPDELEAGAEIHMTMRPFDVGPRQEWTSVITDRREDEHAGYFRDEMRGGPFREWVHTHSFYEDDGGTRIEDRVEYRLPGDGVGDLVGPLAWVGFEPMFRGRHRATKRLLEN
ncbi:SRPBCC family protein [Haloarchaeobius sp. TZWWS8]|uniref:SRPBCC family protein n=1 Tax=Haloarchaeobius sp. TZWWS8 TaxID=3446121 RepID=UPI003EBAD5DE